MKYLQNKNYALKHIIVIPIISTLIIPLIVMDIWMEIYHRLCFPLCGLQYIERKKYIKIDRFKLKYLTFFQKMYCAYCGYGNGAIAYWREIAASTEQYWCGIKHKNNPNFIPQEHQEKMNFAEYGDESDFKKKYPEINCSNKPV